MYSFPNLEPVCCSMSSSYCCFLTCIQISQDAGQVVWYSHFLRIFQSLLWSTQSKPLAKSIKLEVNISLELSCFFYDPMDVGNLISGYSAFSKSSLDEHLEVHSSCTIEAWLGEFWASFTSVWDECNCVVVWAFFGIAFFWDWNENWHFPVLWPLLSFPNLLAYWVQHFHSIIF